MAQKRTIFLHIPKTAGSSFERVINANTATSHAYIGLRSYLTSKNDCGELVKGHMAYGIDFLKLQESRYITLIRNPTERCISYYYFVQEWPKHPSYNDAISHTIIDFYKMKKYQNIQAKSIGGHILLPNDILPINLILSTAKHRLLKIFDFGITEFYAQSVELMCARLNWNNRPIIHTKQGRMRPLSTSVQPEILQKIAELNDADWQLYCYGKELFKQRCEQLDIRIETNQDYSDVSNARQR
jgi:hypothetical protein